MTVSIRISGFEREKTCGSLRKALQMFSLEGSLPAASGRGGAKVVASAVVDG
jgi:hypothetical protein